VNTWELLLNLNEVCYFQTREGKKVGQASNSELKRWCKNQAVRINGIIRKWDEEIPDNIESMTLFTKHKRVTLL